MGYLDWKLLFPASILVAIGSLVLASVAPLETPVRVYYLIAALAIYVLVSRIDFEIFKAAAPILYLFSILLLLSTFIFGYSSRGAIRWIEIGKFSLQSSEIVKPFIILFCSWILFKYRNNYKRYVYILLSGLLPVILIFIQPDLGSSQIIFIGILGVLFFSGISWKIIMTLIAAILIALPVIWPNLAQFQKDRIISFVQPSSDPLGAGYNLIQSIITVGSGGFLGRGLGQGTQSHLLFLPERHTDFIFASIGEELGFLGLSLIVILFSLIFLRLIFLFNKSTDIFFQSFIGGIFLIIFFQAFVNIGMNLGISPITGVPLPFVSSGGSSIVSLAISFGLITSLSRKLP